MPQEACAWVNPNDAVAVLTEEARLNLPRAHLMTLRGSTAKRPT